MESSTRDDGESMEDDALFIRTEDEICLSSTTNSFQAKSYLVKRPGVNEYLVERETNSDKIPCNTWKYRFKIEEAISVHAIHGWKPNETTGTRKMVLYGQAVLISSFRNILRCQSYDQGTAGGKERHTNYQIVHLPIAQKANIDATCWFTILPATKRQSGERVHANDDIYLVNVATKRYMSILLNNESDLSIEESSEEQDQAVATFSPWSWTINIISSAKDKDKFIGYLNGGEVIQIKLLYSKDEFLSVPLSRGHANVLKTEEKRKICFEDKSVALELRSLWKLELFHLNFSGAFVQWGQPFRLSHLASGKFLGIKDDHIVLVDSTDANREVSAFCFVKKSTPKKHLFIDEDGMRNAVIKFGESEVLLFHLSSETWIGQETVGRSTRRRRGTFVSGPPLAYVHHSPPQNTGLAINRNFEIALSAYLAWEIETSVKSLANAMCVDDGYHEVNQRIQKASLTCFKEVVDFLRCPNKDSFSPHEYQKELMFLRNRQKRLNNHGSVKMTFRLLKLASNHHSVHPSPLGLEILESLCKILAVVVTDSPVVCREFASEKNLNSLMDLLTLPYLTHSILEVFDCLLANSPEVLNNMTQKHVESFVKLLNVNGRELKILKLLGKLCVCQDITIRDNQQLVCRHLLKSTDLLVHTKLLSELTCYYANVFLDIKELKENWYYEFHWKPNSSVSKPRHVRAGFAVYQMFRPCPGTNGYRITEGGIGDDFMSIGFDGKCAWTGGNKFSSKNHARSPKILRQQSIGPGKHSDDEDVKCIGCCFDVSNDTIWFTFNGCSVPIKIQMSSFDNDHISVGELFIVPAVSISGGFERAELRFGGNNGSLMYKPPDGFTPVSFHGVEKDIQIRPFVDIGNKETGHLKGPQIIAGQIPFIPSVIDTSQVEVTDCMETLISKLAFYLHESWCCYQLQNGWTCGSTIDFNAKTHPGLKPYEEVEIGDHWVLSKARLIVTTLAALGCTITESLSTAKMELKIQEIDWSEFNVESDYRPCPLVVVNELPRTLLKLLEGLTEASHNAWAEKRFEEGCRYGIKDNHQAKRYKNLLPYHTLDKEAREFNRNITMRILKFIVTLGYNIQPPMFDLLQDLDNSYTQIPFRTFRGQYYPYCTGRGKWYFTVKIVKGDLMRVGWVTQGFSSSNAIGMDESSYAIDGFRASKWHKGNGEKFGQKWKVGDTVVCLLDLDRRIMSFAVGNTLLESPSQETVAFKGFDRNKWYIPAVTLFLGEEVEWNLGDKDGGLAAAGFEGIQTNIKSSIPVWYSDYAAVFEPIKNSQLYSTQYSTNSITVSDKSSNGNQGYFRLNMGIPILGMSTHLGAPNRTEGCVSFSVCFPSSQDIEKVFVGWCTPEMAHDQFWNDNLPDSVYTTKTQVFTRNENYSDFEDAWKLNGEPAAAFMVRLGGLLDHQNPYHPSKQNMIKVNCVLNVQTGDMEFFCEGFNDNRIKLRASVPTKLFPVLVTNPSQEMVCDFIFTPIDKCISIRNAIFGDNIDPQMTNDVISSMEILYLTTGWRHFNTSSSPSITSASCESGFVFPSFPEQKLLYVTLPMEERVFCFSELFEKPDLAEFHLETFKTLKACCMHDNIEAGKEVRNLFSWDQLLYCIKSNQWDYEIRATYFDLFNTLHLEHEVNSRLLVQNDHIFAVESSHDAISAASPSGFRRGSFSQSILNNEIKLDSIDYKFTYEFPVDELKTIFFDFLETLFRKGILSCRLLSTYDQNNILRPLLVAFDSLVVLRLIGQQEEMEKLLSLLHPVFVNQQVYHQTLLTLPSDEPIRLVLCNLLDHLCDCQLQNRLEHIVKFAEAYVIDLQEEQKDRVDDTELSARVLQEINTPTEKQMEAMMSFVTNNEESFPCPTSEELRESLRSFHSRVQGHCGVPKDHVSMREELEIEKGLGQKIGDLVKFLVTFKANSRSKNDKKSRIVKLQDVIKTTLIKWAREGIKDSKLTEKVFLLLHRQFNETEELVKALGSTYVVEKQSESCLDGILEFRSSLGHVRNLLRIGMGEEEEHLLQGKLKILQNSQLFSRHPDLLRLTGVHLTVMNVIKSYLSFNTSLKSKNDHKISVRVERKKKITFAGDGFAGPVEECCRFLQAFAKTSRQNQSALFEYIPYLLEQCCRYPGRLSNDRCTPLDVASAIIKNNPELALGLTEDIFKQIMVLMEKMTYGYRGNGTESESDTPHSGDTSPFSSMSMEWSPFGSLKCLKFLYAAVWVSGETVTQNACVIIKLLIQYPDSLGPGTLGHNLGIVAIFQESFTFRRNGEDSSSSHGKTKLHHQETIVRFERDHATLNRKSQSTLSLNSTTADITLSFYTFLIRLLACCASVNDRKKTPSFKDHGSDHVIPFLQSLVSFDDINAILSLPICTYDDQGVTPKQKQAVLMFLNRVYGLQDKKYLLHLIKDVFFEDVRSNIYLCKDGRCQSKYALMDFYHYLCDYVLPFLECHASIICCCSIDETIIVTSFLKACHQIMCSGHVSSFHRNKIDSWLISITKVLPPQAFLQMIPDLSLDLQDKRSSLFNTALKGLTTHFEYFHAYYSQGTSVTSFACCPPGRQQKVFVALLFNRLVEIAVHKTSDRPAIVQCLKAIVSAISPECFTPPPEKSSFFLDRISYHDCSLAGQALDIEVTSKPQRNGSCELKYYHDHEEVDCHEQVEIPIPSEVMKCMESFAENCHNQWIYNKQQLEFWRYGSKYDADDRTNPYLKPFSSLHKQDQLKLTKVIERCVKELLLWRYVFTHRKPLAQDSIIMKQQMICIRTPKKNASQLTDEQRYASFVPNVIDLDKLKFNNLLNMKVIAESTAIVLNDILHVCGVPDPSTYNPLLNLYKGEGYQETCSFLTDMLKYFHTQGLICSGAFNALPGHFTRNTASIKYAPFGQQLFDKFLTLLQPDCETLPGDCSMQEILYPIVRHYLNCHASYFNPLMENKETTQLYATSGEKIQIAKMLSHFHQFVRRNIDCIVQSPAVAVGKSFKPPNLLSLKDFNENNLQHVMSLSMSLLRALDIHEEDVVVEISLFIQSVTGILEDFPSAIEKEAHNESSLSDMKFLLYCFHCLVPVLSKLFEQLSMHSASKYHFEVVSAHCLNIFNSLYYPAKNHTQVFLKSNALRTVGHCLATFSAFHDCQGTIFGNSTSDMFEQLKWTAAKRFSTNLTAFVGFITIPLITSTFHSKQEKNTNDLNKFVKLCLRIAHEYQGDEDAEWIYTLCESLASIASHCPKSSFCTHICPIVLTLSDRSVALMQSEQLIFSAAPVMSEAILQKQRRQHTKNLDLFSRDVTAIMLFVFRFISPVEEGMVNAVGPKFLHDFVVYTSNILDYYYNSQRFMTQLNSCKKNILFMLLPAFSVKNNTLLLCANVLIKNLPHFAQKAIERFLPLFGDRDKTAASIEASIGQILREDEGYKCHVSKVLETSKTEKTALKRRKKEFQASERIMRIMSYTKYYLHQQKSQATNDIRGRWKSIITRQRREAVLLCLKAVPFYKLKRHRAVNLFLNEYSETWLSQICLSNMERLCERLLDQEDYENAFISSVQVGRCDPLGLLFSTFKTLASTQQWEYVNGALYEAYCDAIVQTTQWVLEDDTGKEGESAAKAYERFHYRLALATNKQKQLLLRGVPSMILAVLAASEGEMTSLVHVTIKLGIVLLEGGNETVQQNMLEELNSLGATVVTSVKELVSSCNVLDWTSYERNYTSAGHDNNIAIKVFSSSKEVTDLFRFLQLLCEGHNEEFQNYLRTQDRSTTTVNIVVATVDYLLKLQESVRDFYWHHAHHDSLELPARECFLVSFKVTRQVFRTLTEYIQGPCVGNQQSLSKSRLWDAVNGYLHIFTSLQHKLFAHTSHMELLREVLDLEEEFFIFLLSMLEGNTMSSSIGRHMLNMLLECETHLTSLIQFYNIFIKLADTATSNAFKEYDLNKDGFISYREFEKAMNVQQHYTREEIDYLMQLADTNKDGLLDYKEFTNRFHQPAHNLGFHLCALFQQLSDILPNDPGVEKLTELSKDLFEHFKGRMGCVEIMGKSSRVERVYFRIKGSRSMQWNDPTIKESRKNFIYNLELTSQRDKLEGFVNFCENTIFEMNYNDTLTGMNHIEQIERAEKHRSTHYPEAKNYNYSPISVNSRFDTAITLLRIKDPRHFVIKCQALLSFLWISILFSFVIKPVLEFSHFIYLQLAFLYHKGEGRLRNRNFRSLTRSMVLKQPNFNLNYVPHIVHSFGSIGSLLANSYYKFKKILLVTTLLINLLILVSIEDQSWSSSADTNDNQTDKYYRSMTRDSLDWLTHIHFILSFALIISSWNRKGQLILFKEEKKTARRLEQLKIFTGQNNGLSFLDRFIVKSPSFPRHFWDKQVKERVVNRTPPQYKEAMSNMLGMKYWSKFDVVSKRQQLNDLLCNIIDARYLLWRFAVVIQEPQVLYHLIYCLLSFAGLYQNVFYFSIHLLDLMFQSKTLVTVLKSLQINMKQLIMTLAMTCVVLYIYTVIGFNFFRKFYQQELSGGEIQDNCDSMWNCFFFHLDKGLRSGGGIADVLVSATGDQQYMLRLSFDMTFFFIVIVILLAVFQGLIIDAFGELRKKQDSITDELNNKCFICGIGKNEFSSPQEFDVHISNHHAMRDYMFFMMHLIGKPETEFTGQESHVWEQYVQQSWSFFPSATCFQIQEKQRALKKIEKGRQALELAVQDVSHSANKTRRHIPSSSNLHHSKTIATM